MRSVRKLGEDFLVAPEEVKRFVTDCMVAVGAATEHGSVLADTLVAADRRGHYSHGLNRLGQFFRYKSMCKKLAFQKAHWHPMKLPVN